MGQFTPTVMKFQQRHFGRKLTPLRHPGASHPPASSTLPWTVMCLCPPPSSTPAPTVPPHLRSRFAVFGPRFLDQDTPQWPHGSSTATQRGHGWLLMAERGGGGGEEGVPVRRDRTEVAAILGLGGAPHIRLPRHRQGARQLQAQVLHPRLSASPETEHSGDSGLNCSTTRSSTGGWRGARRWPSPRA